MERYDYQRMVIAALRQVVRDSLRETAELGLDEDHHFLIEFATRAPGVEMPAFLRDLYPERIVIVLQNQFWNLETDDEHFAVTLSFNGMRQRISVPYLAVESFSDPGAGFGLRFVPPVESEAPADRPAKPPMEDEGEVESQGGEPRGGSVVQFDRFRKK